MLFFLVFLIRDVFVIFFFEDFKDSSLGGDCSLGRGFNRVELLFCG